MCLLKEKISSILEKKTTASVKLKKKKKKLKGVDTQVLVGVSSLAYHDYSQA